MDFHCLKKNKWFNKFNEWFYPSGSTIKNKLIRKKKIKRESFLVDVFNLLASFFSH